jgi:adenylosuccinate synthase
MRLVSAVIGANYGDEGKGHVTDYLCRESEDLVVRFNGGAQAGHTVVSPIPGRRHVFHHFGSGSFVGASTFLSEFFIINPVIFVSELQELEDLKLPCKLKVLADEKCRVTTPWDMLLNQAAEDRRGANRHGSCGLGINETIVRCKLEQYALRFGDLKKGFGWVRRRLRAIREEYIPVRARALDVELSKHSEYLAESMLEHFLFDLGLLYGKIEPMKWDKQFVKDKYRIIFEGAQGLRLDMDHRDFPYVTHSKTGLTCVMKLMKQAEIEEELSVYYVTRTYMTRHGAGPLPHEIIGLPYSKVTDPTNIPNDYQGSLRFGWLDYDHLIEEIRTDLGRAKGIKALPSVAITCTDQIDDERIQLVRGGKRTGVRVEDLVKRLYNSEIMSCITFHGPAQNNVQEW